MMAAAISAAAGMDQNAVLKLMRDGTSMRPEQAKELGIIHDVEECPVARDDRWWTI
jgi:ATP-dependent protease ClpP protease subunit